MSVPNCSAPVQNTVGCSANRGVPNPLRNTKAPHLTDGKSLERLSSVRTFGIVWVRHKEKAGVLAWDLKGLSG